jgi:hypothetical protein
MTGNGLPAVGLPAFAISDSARRSLAAHVSGTRPEAVDAGTARVARILIEDYC